MEDLTGKVANGGASAAGKYAHTDSNQITGELKSLIQSVGLTMTNADLTQALIAVAEIASGKGFWCTCSGTGSAYVLAPTITVANPLYTGLTLKFRPNTNSTVVAPTVNYNGTGVKTIKNEAGDGLVVGDLSTLRDAEIRYDGTDFRLLTRSTNLLLASAYKQGHIRGFPMTNSLADANKGVVISLGEAANSDATLNLVTATTFDKRINANWAAGTAAGGKPSSLTIAAGWYRVFVIGGASASTDFGFDTNSNAGNLLSTATTVSGTTYDKYRQIGWVLVDSSLNITPFYMMLENPEIVFWQQPYVDHNADDLTEARQLQVLTVPPKAVAMSVVTISGAADSNAYYVDLRNPSMTDIAADNDNHVIKSNDLAGGPFKVSTNADLYVNQFSQIAFRGHASGGSALGDVKFTILTRGFKYRRGADE